jgi:hypothetical protein
MRVNKTYIALALGAFCMLAVSATAGQVVLGGDLAKVEQRQNYDAPVIAAGTGQTELPFSEKDTDHGRYISASDAVQHISVTALSSLTFAIVIALVNNDEHDPPMGAAWVPRHTIFHKVLFRAIISPNAP